MIAKVPFPPPGVRVIHPPPVVELEIGSLAATNDKSASSPEKVTAKLVSVDEIVSSPSTSRSRSLWTTLDICCPFPHAARPPSRPTHTRSERVTPCRPLMTRLLISPHAPMASAHGLPCPQRRSPPAGSAIGRSARRG